MAGSKITEPRTLLEYLLRQQDRTYEEVACDFETLARNLGERGVSISARHLRRLASGERTGATPVTRRVLQAMFNRSMDELLQPLPADEIVPITRRGVTSPPLILTQREVLELATQRARKFALTRQASMSSEMTEQIIDDVRELAIAFPQRPLPEILGELVETQDVLFTLLEARSKPVYARQLYFLSGVVGGLLATASLDLSDSHGALTQARTAFLCADHADHDGLRAWVRALQSMFAYWAGRPHESVQYAQSGVLFAATAGNSTTVRLPVTEARAWARLGNAGQARAAIERAERARDQVRLDDLDELGGLCSFNQPWQLYYASDALAWLPEEAETAERYSQQAIAAYRDASAPGWAFSCQALSQVNLAIARMGRGEVDGAAEILAPVFALPPEKRIAAVVQSVQRVHDPIHRSSSARNSHELQEKIEAFTSTPLRALPR